MATQSAPSFSLREEDGRTILAVVGDWTVASIGKIDAALRKAEPPATIEHLDVQDLGQLDTAGAFLIDRTMRDSCDVGDPPLTLIGEHENVSELIAQMRAVAEGCEPEAQPPQGFTYMLERLGRGSNDALHEGLSTLSFLGETLATLGRLILNPGRIRWTQTFAVMERAGIDAIPIVAFLSFFVGLVVAYMGATTLSAVAGSSGEIFTVELVGISVLREFGVLLTAIILAGRTNSAFTAQIGAMKMRQEVDAMTTLGLSPMEVLVAPRVIALVVMVPILTFVGMVSGIFGGLIVSWTALDINPTVFIHRLQDMVPAQNFWVGMSKAPIFALVLALIGCRQGLQVGGSVQSLGSRTTTSVVQAIFSIIVIDAIFAIFYMELDI